MGVAWIFVRGVAKSGVSSREKVIGEGIRYGFFIGHSAFVNAVIRLFAGGDFIVGCGDWHIENSDPVLVLFRVDFTDFFVCFHLVFDRWESGECAIVG